MMKLWLRIPLEKSDDDSVTENGDLQVSVDSNLHRRFMFDLATVIYQQLLIRFIFLRLVILCYGHIWKVVYLARCRGCFLLTYNHFYAFEKKSAFATLITLLTHSQLHGC